MISMIVLQIYGQGMISMIVLQIYGQGGFPYQSFRFMDREGFHISKSELLYVQSDNLGIRKYLIGARFFIDLSRLSVNMPFESQEKWGQRCGTVGVCADKQKRCCKLLSDLNGILLFELFLLEGKSCLCKLQLLFIAQDY